MLVASCYLLPANRKYALKPGEINNLFKDINKLRKNCDLFIYGDFSYPSISWCHMSSIKEAKISFLEKTENFEVHQNVKLNTASTGTLDLIFTSDKIHATDVHILYSNDKLGKLSNYYLVEISFNVELSDLMRRKFSKESIFSYCNVDYDFFNEQIIENLIDTYCWSKVYVILNHWYNWLSPLIKKCIPKRTKHRSSLPPWISQLTSNLIKRLHTAQIYSESHPKNLHLKEQTKTNAEMEKADYEQSPATEKSRGKLLNTLKLFIIQAYQVY